MVIYVMKYTRRSKVRDIKLYITDPNLFWSILDSSESQLSFFSHKNSYFLLQFFPVDDHRGSDIYYQIAASPSERIKETDCPGDTDCRILHGSGFTTRGILYDTYTRYNVHIR